MVVRLISPLFFSLWFSLAACAQSSVFFYQGRLLENAAAATGNYDFVFKLFDQETGGSQQGATLSTNALPVANGLFSLDLDFGAAAFTGAARWLEVGVHRVGDGGGFITLNPRQQLAATPYAIRAAAASTFTGAVADAQLSSNVALRNANQTFTGAVGFTSAAGNFSGNGAGLTNINLNAHGGLLSGRIGQLPSSPGTTFGGVSGSMDVAPLEAQAVSLSPNETVTAANLAIRLNVPAGAGASLTFTLRVNGADTPVSCTLSGSGMAADSGLATANIPPASQICIGVTATGVPAANVALFGLSLR